MAAISNDLFQEISCPLCTAKEFDVLRRAQHPDSVTVEHLKNLYSASSSHILLDQVVQCRSCRLQYVNPRPRAELILESYSEAVDPTFVAQNDQRIRTFTQSLKRVLRDLKLPSGEGKRLLDIGCAGGALLVAARNIGFKPTGVEPSRWMADYGRRTYGLDVRDGILVEGMFPPRSFDVITLWDVLEHIPSPGGLLNLIYTLLRPGGVLVLSYPDAGSVAARLLGWRWPFWLSVHLLYYDRGTICAQLERCRFRILSVRPYWQRLQLGYVFMRATPYFRPARILEKMSRGLGVAGLGVTYNMGQTMVLARRD